MSYNKPLMQSSNCEKQYPPAQTGKPVGYERALSDNALRAYEHLKMQRSKKSVSSVPTHNGSSSSNPFRVIRVPINTSVSLPAASGPCSTLQPPRVPSVRIRLAPGGHQPSSNFSPMVNNPMSRMANPKLAIPAPRTSPLPQSMAALASSAKPLITKTQSVATSGCAVGVKRKRKASIEGIVSALKKGPEKESDVSSKLALSSETSTATAETSAVAHAKQPLASDVKKEAEVEAAKKKTKKRKRTKRSADETAVVVVETRAAEAVEDSVLAPEKCLWRRGTAERSPCWLLVVNKHVMPGVASLGLETVLSWSVDDVADFVHVCVHSASDSAASVAADKFRQQQIDGEALVLLTQHDIANTLSIKLGPALKIFNAILSIKHAKANAAAPS